LGAEAVMKKLPIGIQSFRKLREGDYAYADKTGYVQRLAADGGYFILSRPRRFGKSLFVDTLKEAFSGNRDLFAGLALADSDFDFTPRPVIRLDLSGGNLANPETLRSGLLFDMQLTAEVEEVQIDRTEPAEYLQHLIVKLERKYGQRAVVLIDEYDKPIVDHIARPELAEANRAELRTLYGVLKKMDAHLRFVFLTGVSKFTRTSIFSQLNNLYDITLRRPYENICGITESEFDALFGEHLAALGQTRRAQGLEADAAKVRELVFQWYDGYSWDGLTRVFNPFSLLNLFQAQQFYPYWYATGVPQFLVELLKQRPADYAQFQSPTITEAHLDSYEVEQAPLESLLFQTGFLTIQQVDLSGFPPTYRLGFPNLEVSTSFAKAFLETVAPRSSQDARHQKLVEELNRGNAQALEEALAGLFASIPYNLHQDNEAYYHSLFLAYLQSVNLRAIPEAAVAGGEADGLLDTPTGHSYVVEFKYVKAVGEDPAATARDLNDAVAVALAQIRAKAYADLYRGTGRVVHQVGVAVTGRGHIKVGVA
jgi:hypothetical protein